MHPAIYVIWFGVLLSLVSFIWFRHPGVPFWFQAPPWRAREFLTTAGVWLWGVGSVVGSAGIVWFMASNGLANPVVRTVVALIVVTLASAIAQIIFGEMPVKWWRAFALAFGVLSGLAVVEHFELSGAVQFIALGVWIALLVAAAELLPIGKARSDA